jgi:hypothetical protein
MKKRLPNFNTSKLWNKIHEKMGVEEIIELPKIDIGAITYREIQALRTSSLDIENILDHINPIDDTFEYKGQKVFLYIKEQHYDIMRFDGIITYKYHLAYCRTLYQMENAGRFKKRYVVTQRTDGKFVVDIIDRLTSSFHEENKLYRMNVCKNCLSKLADKYPHEVLFHYGTYDLQSFIEKYNTQHTKLPPHSPSSLPKNEYPDNWSSISNNRREGVEYVCEDCGKDFSNRKNNLHVHHIDGMKYNNSSNNLRVLCIHCHSEQPGHAKLKYKGYSNNV